MQIRNISFLMILFLCTAQAFAVNLGGLKLPGKTPATDTSSGNSDTDESPYAKQPAYNMPATDLANQVVAYIKQKFQGDSDVYKTALEPVIAHMSKKYGPPSNKNDILAEWILHAEGINCAKMRFSFDGRFTNITRVVGPCSMVD